RAPWYPGADGFGESLQRLSTTLYGNDPANWTAAAPAPGPSAAADTDLDGIPNSWELANGLNPNNEDDAEEDPDDDGFTNLQEYRAGTDPQSAQSHLRLGPIAAVPGAVMIEFHAAAGITYSISYRPELHTGGWLKLIDIPAQSTAQFIRVFDPSPDPRRFYRLVTPSMP
ncbi:MAG TPA: Amuc_1099 family pilus-like system protein, partial [Verrucomicrobiae bacterium]|nr:Amuc_1099 family pilus-like system protein [Verrucomicrobiae bacterium]